MVENFLQLLMGGETASVLVFYVHFICLYSNFNPVSSLFLIYLHNLSPITRFTLVAYPEFSRNCAFIIHYYLFIILLRDAFRVIFSIMF